MRGGFYSLRHRCTVRHKFYIRGLFTVQKQSIFTFQQPKHLPVTKEECMRASKWSIISCSESSKSAKVRWNRVKHSSVMSCRCRVPPRDACRQLQWRTDTSRQCLWRNDVSASFRRAPPLPASHDGGADVFPPTSMADSVFRQSQWQILISATGNGGNSHVSPLGAPARPEMAIKFGGGHFWQFDWAEVYICKKIHKFCNLYDPHLSLIRVQADQQPMHPSNPGSTRLAPASTSFRVRLLARVPVL
jgi:hypothetical protein